MKKISIITPCFNAEKYIKETCLSVINQSAILEGRADLEYIICDGKSTDNTLSIIESIGAKQIKIISEPDHGLYDALSKGLKLVSGDVCAYINAGDYYHRCAFDIVLDVMEANDITWVTGYNCIYNEKSYAFPVYLPYKYKKRFFDCGIYGTILPHVQQESTFWHSSLNNQIDYDILSSLKLAGDYYLWLKFSQVDILKIVTAVLGGFKIHKGQLSQNKELYDQEIMRLTRKPNLSDFISAYFDKLIWYSPDKIKRMMNKEGIVKFDHKLQHWV